MKMFRLIGHIGFMEKDSIAGEPYHESLSTIDIDEIFSAMGVIEAKREAKNLIQKKVDDQKRKPDSVIVGLMQIVCHMVLGHPQPVVKAKKQELVVLGEFLNKQHHIKSGH